MKKKKYYHIYINGNTLGKFIAYLILTQVITIIVLILLLKGVI